MKATEESHDAGNGKEFSLSEGALLVFEAPDLNVELNMEVSAECNPVLACLL